MNDREAMKMALELLKRLSSDLWMGNRPDKVDRTILALEVALAQPEQEPVAYKYTDKTNPLVFYFTERKGKDVTQNPDVIETALYTAPPKQPWVGLHLDDIPETYAGDKSFLNIAKWAEAKLKEKNT